MHPDNGDMSTWAHTDGNVLHRGEQLRRRISRHFLGPDGVFTKFLTALDLLLLVLFALAQAVLLDSQIGMPLFLIFDSLVIFIFICSVCSAKRHFERKCSDNPTERANCNVISLLGHKLSFPDSMGEVPMIYLSWLFYTLLLMIKICILHLHENTQEMLRQARLVEITYAVTSVIFLLFVEAHRNSEDEMHRERTRAWTDGLMQHTMFEIFDSVLLLDLILPETTANPISENLRLFIVLLASANFLMPTIGLYHLSQLAACNSSCSSLNLVGMSRTIGIHIFRLFGINIAYLIIRVHLSSSYDKSLSIFVIKNLLGIFMALRSLFKEVFEYIEHRKALKEKRREREQNNPKTGRAVEMVAIVEPGISAASLRAMGGDTIGLNGEIVDQNFDEISLTGSQKRASMELPDKNCKSNDRA